MRIGSAFELHLHLADGGQYRWCRLRFHHDMRMLGIRSGVSLMSWIIFNMFHRSFQVHRTHWIRGIVVCELWRLVDVWGRVLRIW